MEGYSAQNTSAGWFRIKNDFIQNREFGYVHSLFNTSNENLLIGGNRDNPFFTYNGAVMQSTVALPGGGTTVTVDSTLVPDVYEAMTATANTTTTITVATAAWAVSQWVNFHVLIKTGAQVNVISRITSNTATTITFNTIGAPGNVEFEIRRTLIPDTGTIIYNNVTTAYSAIPTQFTLTTPANHAAPIGTIVTLSPTNFPENPRGNRFTNYLGRLIIGNVRSALGRDSTGNLQGSASGSTAFMSQVNNPLNYVFAAPRIAGEGDMISTPYGGGDITDVVAQENQAYIFKRDYVEAISYTQDATDLIQREPLKPGVGSIGKTTRGTDDVYFFTPSKQFSSIGRVRSQDSRPQTQDIGFRISRWLRRCNVDEVGRGIEVAGKVYVPMKSSDQSTFNDIVLVYNRISNSFEGIWDIGAFGLSEFNNEYYYSESGGPNVFKMFNSRNADVEGDIAYPYSFEVATHFFNLLASKQYQQGIHGMIIEGYIRGGTTFSSFLWKDFNDTPSVTFNFASSETAFLDGEGSNIYWGDAPMGINNLSIDYTDIDSDGRRHFVVRIYFPFVYGQYFSVGASSSGVDQDFEITRFGVMIEQENGINIAKVKAS
jgi:hypothetical protein